MRLSSKLKSGTRTPSSSCNAWTPSAKAAPNSMSKLKSLDCDWWWVVSKQLFPTTQIKVAIFLSRSCNPPETIDQDGLLYPFLTVSTRFWHTFHGDFPREDWPVPNNTDCIKVPGAQADNCRRHFCQSCLHCVDSNLNLAKLGNGMFLQDHTMPWQSFFSVKLSKRKQSNSTAEQWDEIDPVAGAVQLRSAGPYPCRASQEPRVGTWQGEERGRYRQRMERNNFILNPGTVQN